MLSFLVSHKIERMKITVCVIERANTPPPFSQGIYKKMSISPELIILAICFLLKLSRQFH